jgi:hypothetical protein
MMLSQIILAIQHFGHPTVFAHTKIDLKISYHVHKTVKGTKHPLQSTQITPQRLSMLSSAPASAPANQCQQIRDQIME